MPSRYQAPRGTQDVLPPEQAYWRFVRGTIERLMERFGYGRIDTPIFEQTALFVRSVGEGTDIVEKEIYTFLDRGGDELTLRPEGTAPVCRAYLEHGMGSRPQPVRLYYLCPIFRYERPQAGRFRQHHQFGIEAIGDPDASVDAEVIEVGWRLTEALGLGNLSLAINSIGCPNCRPSYLKALVAHYEGHADELCPDCKVRLQRNPLRLLDCKRTDFACHARAAEAPRSTDLLCSDCAAHWDGVKRYLDALNIAFREEHRLVRGLDYYTRTVFEIQPPEEGAQATILGGGRYDGLIQELGGKPTPGVGFGCGVERLIVNLKRQGVAVRDNERITAVVVALDSSTRPQAMALASRLRKEGHRAVLTPAGKSLKGQLRHASALNARFAVILGQDEAARGLVALKDMDTGEQREVPFASLVSEISVLSAMEGGPKEEKQHDG